MSTVSDEYERLQSQWSDLADWTISVSRRMTSTAGMCYHSIQTIRIAEWLVLRAPRSEVIDTVRHEVAHALIGVNHGHDELWKFACQLVGADPTRLYDKTLVPLTARARRR